MSKFVAKKIKKSPNLVVLVVEKGNLRERISMIIVNVKDKKREKECV